jgi:pyruvate ferredoxin oxidoreductase alpha subunit
MLEDAVASRLGRLTFLDLDHGVVERELGRMAERRRSGPTAENILRDIGTGAGGRS